MDITITLEDEYAGLIGMKVVSLEHLVRILTFQTEEKGMTVSGNIAINRDITVPPISSEN